MLRLLAYLISKGISTAQVIPELLGEDVDGLPLVTDQSCATGCGACVDICPTEAISKSEKGNSIEIDRGACIGCNLCVQACESGTVMNDRSTATWSYTRQDLIQSSKRMPSVMPKQGGIFNNSLAVRVISTGCSACDLELCAANNPIFDMDRFGVHVVASPRFADALVIVGPAPKAMHQAILSCYQAMAEPKIVIALGTCAISGGLHSHGYAEANGVGNLLPVDVYIPGCPPHPWSIIKGILAAKALNLSKGSRVGAVPQDDSRQAAPAPVKTKIHAPIAAKTIAPH